MYFALSHHPRMGWVCWATLLIFTCGFPRLSTSAQVTRSDLAARIGKRKCDGAPLTRRDGKLARKG
jgi:hypothetical protein